MYIFKLKRSTNTFSVRHTIRNFSLSHVGRRGEQGADGAAGPPGAQGPQGEQGIPGEDGLIQSIVAGDNITVDDTDPANPVVSATSDSAVDSVNGQTGTVVLDQDDVGDGTTYKQYSATEKTKLGFISVSQSVNLDTMESDIVNKQPLDSDLTSIAGLNSSTSGAIASDGAGWVKKTYAQFKTAIGLVKGDVGLGNVDNTSDANKPVSTAQQTALDAKLDSVVAGTNVTVDNTDPNNPVINASGSGGVSMEDAVALAVSL